MLVTTAQLASLVGVQPRRLLQLASVRKVEPAMIAGRVKLWNKEDAKLLKPGKAGRPRKVTP